MQAVVYTEYGSPDVLRLKEVTQPVPKPGEILVRVVAAPVSFGDIMARKFNTITPRTFTMPALLWLPSRLMFGLRRPRKTILGSEYSGEVVAVGATVTRFKVGDQVFGYSGTSFGAYAEYLCVAETAAVALKPANLAHEQAAAVPYGALTALNLLKKAHIQPGQKVLINGASGGIGSAALQLARHYGAEVTGVCSTPRVELVRALGAHKVIDYTREDFTQNGETYDLILDILGKSSFARCKGSLTPGGRYLLASFKLKQLLQMLWTAIVGGPKVICALSMESQADLIQIRELVEAGVLTAIVDRRFAFAQAAEAHRYVESGRKTGAVLLTWPS